MTTLYGMKKYEWIALALGLWIIGRLVLGSALGGQLLNYDDERYIASNAVIDTLDSDHMRQMFTGFFDGHYHPLTLLSLAIDKAVFEDDITGHHRVSLGLHLLNSVLLLLLLLKMGLDRWVSVGVALVWMLHPMQPESFVWMTERKNVLYAFFFGLSAYSYLHHLQGKGGRWAIWAAYGFALLSLLSKAQAVVLLPLWFLLDHALGRSLKARQTWVEKLPLALIFVGFVAVTAQAQTVQWGASMHAGPGGLERPMLALYAFVLYFLKGLIPFGLSAYYPYPSDCGGNGAGWVWMGIPFLLGYGYVLYRLYVMGRRTTVFGLAFFLLNLLPVLKFGSIPFGEYLMADRYAYIPLAGLWLAVFAELQSLLSRMGRGSLLAYIAGALGLVMAIAVQPRIDTWSRSEALWSEVLERCPDYFHARNMRALARVADGRNAEAAADWTASLETDPLRTEARLNLAILYAKTAQPAEALRVLNEGIHLLNPLDSAPETARLYNTAAALYARGGQAQRALSLLDSLGPQRADSALYRSLSGARGVIEHSSKEEIPVLSEVDREQASRREKASVLSGRATELAKAGRFPEAKRLFAEALKLDSTNARIWLNSGTNKAQSGDLEGALRDFERCVATDPQLGIGYLMLGMALKDKGAKGAACAAFVQAQSLGVALPPDVRSYCSSRP
ncbi:tetratricopeptide repeat protein [bacterium]|nr:tetratricopeptide repeat protein [bacterium]